MSKGERGDLSMPPHAVAIVGLAGRFPDAVDLDAFWRNVANGVESLRAFSDADLDAAGVPAALRVHPNYVRAGTVLDDAEFFDAAFFGLSPREAQVIDPQHRVFLECAWEALEHAGYAVGAVPPSVGVYAGASMNSYVYAQLLRNRALAEAVGGYQVMLGNDKDFLCTRVSYKLDLRGPSMAIQTACSTSLVAVQVACRALQRRECDMALAGGVSLTFPLRSGHLYQEGMILSPDGKCRPFDVDARGTRAGAGAGVVVLKRFDDALADGDTVHAVIRGIAVNNDGAGKAGYTAPSIDGQVEVIATAQALADVSPRSISYVEAHGTATPLGDPIEIAALTRAFRAGTSDEAFCRLGSLKANLGHLDAAAGVAGLIKTVLALENRVLPPLVNFTAPNPALQLEHSPFVASAATSVWETPAGVPRRAGVSSFGIGGTNAHAVLEEAPPRVERPPARVPQLLLLSARSDAALDAATVRLADHLQCHPELDLADVASTLQNGRVAFPHRRIVVAAAADQAIAALRAPHHASVLQARHEGGPRQVAFLFSGQGSQYAGMGRGLYDGFAVYRDAVDRCAELLQPLLGEDIRGRLYAGSGDSALGETRFTQPALFVASYALAQLWRHWGVVPAAMLGHSIGEYVAAHLAGVMSLADALMIVEARGRLMQRQPPGRMAAVPLSAAELGPWLVDGVEVAAANAPGLCTVSGPEPGIDALVERLARAGMESRVLRTSHAFHSAMMEPVLADFVKVCAAVKMSSPTIPYVSNLTGSWITSAQATSPQYYADHLRHAVRFDSGMRTLASDAALHFLEVGPGDALASLARMNLGAEGGRRVVASMRRAADARSDAEVLLEAAGRLWLAGATPHWPHVHEGPRVRVPLPTYPFERRRHAVDPAADSPTVADTIAPGRRSSHVADWFYAPTWCRSDSTPRPLTTGTWLVLGDRSALTDAVCAALRAAAVQPVRVERGPVAKQIADGHYQARPGEADDLAAIADALRIAGSTLRGVLSLWSLPAFDAAPLVADATYHTLVAVAAAVQRDCVASSVRIVHATAGAESVFDEPVRDHLAALSAGPVLVLPTELPGLQLRSVDLALRDATVDIADAVRVLIAEVGLPDTESLVAYRAGRRWVRRYERLALPPMPLAQLPFKSRGLYLITGGLGGMGLALARWLGKEWQARLVLTARSVPPARDEWDDWLRSHPADDRHVMAIATIREIESSGGEVLVVAADAGDEDSMKRVVDAARHRFGTFDGVVHAAGVSGRGGMAVLATPADARSVFAPKLQGLEVLVRLLGAQALDVVVLMGSINAVVGAPGACDYSAANAVFDAFVDSESRPERWRQVVTVDWGAWRDVGMAAKLQVADAVRDRWREHLEGAIRPVDGIDALARVLASGRRRVVVDTYDLVRTTESVRHSFAAVVDVDQGPKSGNPAASLRVAGNAPDEVQTLLLGIWTELLGTDDPGLDDDFFALGGHSLLATRAISRIEATTGARLTLRDIFDAPTVRLLSERLGAIFGSRTPTLLAGDPEREEFEF